MEYIVIRSLVVFTYSFFSCFLMAANGTKDHIEKIRTDLFALRIRMLEDGQYETYKNLGRMYENTDPAAQGRAIFSIDHTPMDSQVAAGNETPYACPICLADIREGNEGNTEYVVTLRCKHYFHQECLERTWAVQVSDHELSCPACSLSTANPTEIAHTDVRTYFHFSPVYFKWLENYLASAGIKLCPRCKAGLFVPTRRKQLLQRGKGKVYWSQTCTVCHTTLCPLCIIPHEGLTCEEANAKLNKPPYYRETLAVLEENPNGDYGCCPSCNAFMERVSGCNSMLCGNDFHLRFRRTQGCGSFVDWKSAIRNFNRIYGTDLQQRKEYIHHLLTPFHMDPPVMGDYGDGFWVVDDAMVDERGDLELLPTLKTELRELKNPYYPRGWEALEKPDLSLDEGSETDATKALEKRKPRRVSYYPEGWETEVTEEVSEDEESPERARKRIRNHTTAKRVGRSRETRAMAPSSSFSHFSLQPRPIIGPSHPSWNWDSEFPAPRQRRAR